MSNDLETLAKRLRDLIDEWGVEEARAVFEKRAAQLSGDQRERLHVLTFGRQNQFGAVSVGDMAGADLVKGAITVPGALHGAAVGVNQGTVQLFFGRQPPVEGEELLNSYFEALVAEHGLLRLGKLLGKEQSGREQAAMPAISLRAVYTALATNAWTPGDIFTLDREAILQAMDAGDPARVLPDKVCLAATDEFVGRRDQGTQPGVRALISGLSLLEEWLAARQEIANKVPGTRLSGRWYRPEIPLNAITEHARLVLLGDPGSGKSTVLRYLVVWLAETLLAGNAAEKPVPLFCPLGRVAQRLSADPESDLETLIDVLLQPIIGAAGLRAELRAPMLAAWRTGSVLLCLDGLDEVSGILEPTRLGLRSRRERIAEAIRQLARQLGRAHCRHLPDEAL